MKTFTLSAVAVFSLLLSSFFAQANSILNTGIKLDYSLLSGDTLRVASGNYTGKLTGFTNGAVVIISAGATFTPETLATPGGKILNFGTCTLKPLGTYSGFQFENYGLATVSGALNLYDGATQVWNNYASGKLIIQTDFAMNNAVFTNYGSVSIGGNFNMYAATSNFINKGLLFINKNLAVNSGILDNQNRIYTDNFNAYGGQVLNSGSIIPDGTMTFNAGTTYANQCLMITDAGFTNYGTFQNNGLLWVGRSGTATDQFYNSGTFTNSSDAQVKAVKLVNYGTLNGGGSYYINGSSSTSGTVGTSAKTTDTIKVYDVTRASTSSVFDVQYGTVNPNVVYRAFAQPDTNQVNYAGCSSYYRANQSSLLPVEWLYFEAKLVQKEAVLNWSAQFEQGMRFDVERSYDNSQFTTVSTLVSNNTKAYSYSEASPENASVVYFRIKATSVVDGTVKYSETKTLKLRSVNAASLSVYPNPAKDMATVSYKANSREQITLTVRNAAGQNLFAKSLMTPIGTNTINLNEIATLKGGLYIIEVQNVNGFVGSTQLIKQ